ncbi:hypothetical protein ACHAPT_001810 [Fusarium lateritium]
MRSLKDGTRMFDIRMNPYHVKYTALPTETRNPNAPAQPPMPTLTPNPGLSPYHDGRIRNPVPSKLKGKTDGRQGNFSVMQIDVPRPEMTARDLAAKRTSEGTAAAARIASSQGYRHPKRPRSNGPTGPPVRFRSYPTPVLPAPPRPIPQPPPLAPAVPVEKAPIETAPAEQTPASNPPTQATSPSIQEISPPAQEIDPPSTGHSGLSPHDTKTEQARLLTLLRSLHPILVVDQLCKALAYFGGIPGAPPPTDGVFPQSAATNGPGSLFVAWVSEIFPHLDNIDKAAVTQAPPAIPPIGAPEATSNTNSSTANAAPVTVKRSRGRPKGSKSSKVRKDKGIKKKGVAGSGAAQTSEVSATQSTPAEQAPEASQPPTADDQEQSAAAAAAAVTQANSNPTVQPTTPHVGKKRGRPKGSKNKPKPQPGTQDGGADTSNVTATNPVVDSPLAHKTTSNQQDGGNTGVGLNGMPSTSVQPETNGSVLIQEPAVTSDADNNVDQQPPPTPLSNLSNQSTPNAAPRKRKPSQQTPQANVQAMATTNTLQVPDVMSRSGNSPQTQNAKRRRVSEEMSQQNIALSGTESHSAGVEASVSPNMAPNGQPSSASSSFDSQGQINHLGGGVNHQPQQLVPQQRQQMQQQQQQHQNLNLHQFDQNQQPPQQQQQQQSPDMSSEQPSQTQQMPPTALNRSRNRLPGTPARISNREAHAIYERQKQHYQQRQRQRQMTNHFGQPAAAASFSRTMGSNSPTQFQQQQQQHTANTNLGYNGRQSLSQHQHPQQQPQHQQHQQHPQTQPNEPTGAPNMAQFQDFNSQNYLDMDYSMNAGTAVAFDNHTQLEAALAEPDMRDRIYHAIGR